MGFAGRLAITAIATLCAWSPVHGQCRLCAQPSTLRAQDTPADDVQVQVETNLNFDQLLLAGAGSGSVTIKPDGSISSEGMVAQAGPRAMVGTVLVHGRADRELRIELPRRIQLYSLSGGRVTLEDVATDVRGTPRLDGAGNLSFRFGGRLVVSGDTDGRYRGDLPITVEYADDSGPTSGSLTGR